MALLAEDLVLSESEYKKFVDFIYKQSGIALGDSKQELVKTRFGKRIRKLGLKSFKEYYDFVVHQKNEDELVDMIDAISTNYTFFFREKDHFDFLTKVALPEILHKKKSLGNQRIRAWCAAASTGEEPYTLMICLLEATNMAKGWDAKLLATDISTRVLKKAQAGIYEYKQIKTVPKLIVDKYFDSVTADGEKQYHAKSIMKQHLHFRHFNLMTPRFPFKGKFDFIFCRNVMIYFDRETQEMLVGKMLDFLDPGGYLFIGHSENLTGAPKERVKVLGPALYQKLV